MSHKPLAVAAGIALITCAFGMAESDVDDASGLVVANGRLAVVGNRNDGHVFTYDLDVIPIPGKTHYLRDRWETIDFDQNDDGDEFDEDGTDCDDDRSRKDFEDVGVLAGRLIALSECQAALFDKSGILIAYDSKSDEWPVSGIQNAGLEGVSVWDRKDGRSDVAVALEGRGRSPRVYWHTVSHASLVNRPLQVAVTDCKKFKLDIEELEELTKLDDPDEDKDFRVTALVFTRDGKGFIMLLSHGSNKWLLKCDRSGRNRQVRTLEQCSIKKGHVWRNWEGIAWSGDSTLVLIADNANGDSGTTRLAGLKLPAGW